MYKPEAVLLSVLLSAEINFNSFREIHYITFEVPPPAYLPFNLSYGHSLLYEMILSRSMYPAALLYSLPNFQEAYPHYQPM